MNDHLKIDRLLGIILMLHTKKILRAEEIARHFGVSVRTVYRDMKILYTAGLPIGAEAGEGYSLMEGYKLPPVMFSDEEASALFIGAGFLRELSDASQKKHIDTALLKIRSILPERKREYLEALQNSVAMYPRPAHMNSGDNETHLTEVQRCVATREVLRIEYHAFHSDKYSERLVEPLGLLYYGNFWHIIAYCRLRTGFRDFRLDRVRRLRMTGEHFAERPGFSLKRYIREHNRLENPIEVVLHFQENAARLAANKFYYGLVEEVRTESGVKMTFVVPSLEWFGRWVISFGVMVEILRPLELHEIIRNEIRQLAEKYRIRDESIMQAVEL